MKMECHPKAPELLLSVTKCAVKDLVDQMSQSCGSTDSRCYEQILGREVKEEYTRTSEKLKCKWNVMKLGRLMISSQGIEFNSWCGSTVERIKNLKMLNKRPFDDTVDADEKNPMEPVYAR